MRIILTCVLAVFATTAATAQTACTASAQADVIQAVHKAQAAALAIQASDMDSGVPSDVAPLLLALKQQLALAADIAITCAPLDANVAELQARLDALLHQAAPTSQASPQQEAPDKPHQGLFGNNATAKVSALAGTPPLIEVDLTSSEVCGSDTQLLLYEKADGRWQRALRWFSPFAGSDDRGRSWGDFTLTRILLPDPTHPEDWRAVFAHGTPWCTSRFSSFGLAVLAPDRKTGDARVVWQTERSYSRGDYTPRLRVIGDTFELRLHADEMSFNEDGFERLVVYRYRLHDDSVTRLEPLAANARGFVEEWLSMPWQEALAQAQANAPASLEALHRQYEQSYPSKSDSYTVWRAGPVRACTASGRFQVAFASQRNISVPGKPGGRQDPPVTHYFHILQVADGYQMLSVSETRAPDCAGSDLMGKAR